MTFDPWETFGLQPRPMSRLSCEARAPGGLWGHVGSVGEESLGSFIQGFDHKVCLDMVRVFASSNETMDSWLFLHFRPIVFLERSLPP